MSWNHNSKPLGDHEYPEPDPDDDDTYDVVNCPECGAEVFEDLDQCPICLNYLSTTTRALAGRPAWWMVLAIVLLIALTLMSI